MRSDYGLYGVAVICFIISAVFAASAVPGYQLSDPDTWAMGVSVTVIFLVVGIIAAVLGYSVRPKPTMPTATSVQPAPTATSIAPAPVPEPEPEPQPQPEPQLPPAPPLQKVEEIMVEPQASTSTPSAEPSEPIETVPVETQETAAMKTEEEEKPKDKPVRRRRKKAE